MEKLKMKFFKGLTHCMPSVHGTWESIIVVELNKNLENYFKALPSVKFLKNLNFLKYKLYNYH